MCIETLSYKIWLRVPWCIITDVLDESVAPARIMRRSGGGSCFLGHKSVPNHTESHLTRPKFQISGTLIGLKWLWMCPIGNHCAEE